jgi:hypothetical protein
MMKEHFQRLADAIAPLAWLAWLSSHFTQINQILQFILLITSIFASLTAGMYHWRKRKILDRRD